MMEVDVTKEKRSRSDWQEFYRAWAKSGESRKEFARRHGLNPKTFSWWCTQLRHELGATTSLVKSSGFIEVVAARPQPNSLQPTAAIVVRVGEVVVDFGAALPPAWWVAEVAARC
jgi:transposase-like protein